MFSLGCFNIHQVYAWQPGFDRNNFVRWSKNGLLIRLRQGYYTFPEYKGKSDFTLYFANRIYRPSYVSLHTALSFYGMIPEAVVQITSVTSLKTASFTNNFGEYDYKSIKQDLMFGYNLKPIADGKTLQLARPEKALLDLLYLYPFYNTRKELEDLLQKVFITYPMMKSRRNNVRLASLRSLGRCLAKGPKGWLSMLREWGSS